MAHSNGNTPQTLEALGVTLKAGYRTTITADEMHAMMIGSDIPTLKSLYARIVESCPEAWGDPDDPTTYGKINYDDLFVPLLLAIGEDIKKDRKR